jgi:hypothetical protein
MIGQQLFFHSPFSLASIVKNESPSLLLQLIVRELIASKEYLIETPTDNIAPFSWASKAGTKNKVQEHAQLLEAAFPELAKQAKKFLNSLDKSCSELIAHLEPFILACKDNENLLFFLVKHQKSLGIKSILDKICPDGLAKLKTKIAARYKKRGFHISKWTH